MFLVWRKAWTVVSFALSASGTADQSSLIGDGAPAAVFVNRAAPTGFFSVAIKVLDLTGG